MKQYSRFILHCLLTPRAGYTGLLHSCIPSWKWCRMLLHTCPTVVHDCAGTLQPDHLRKEFGKSTRNDFNLTGEHLRATREYSRTRLHYSRAMREHFFAVRMFTEAVRKHYRGSREYSRTRLHYSRATREHSRSVRIARAPFCTTPEQAVSTHAPAGSNQKPPKQAPFQVFYVNNEKKRSRCRG